MIELNEGIEVRNPFLDDELFELVVSICHQERIRGPRPKSLLRDAMATLLPDETLRRSDYPNFDNFVQFDCLARNQRSIGELLESSLLASWQLVDGSIVRRYQRRIQDTRGFPLMDFTQLLIAELWARSNYGEAR
jgi:asparagine synthetase B (glutamine-hydrolysing)